MDNYPIKSVAFGGFDKQDVIRYIQQTAQQNTAAQEELRKETDALRAREAALAEELDALKAQFEASAARCEQLERDLARETAARQALESLKALEEKNAALTAEADALRPDAQAYAQFRERIGAIECEARKRADDLEAATHARLQQTLSQFRAQYQTLMSTLEVAATHINGELRKVEVNLSQLPRAMDKTGADLEELAAQLKNN